MKLFTLLILISLATASAKTSYSQQTKFTLNLEHATVKQLFDKIEGSSEFIFVYYDNIIDLNKEVSVTANNETVEEILEKIFKSSDNTFKVFDRQIVIAIKENSDQQPQKKELSGTVKDTNGLLLSGVTVYVKGSTNGTTTDNDGNFRFSVPLDSKILVFSFIGMKSQEVVIEAKTSFKIELSEQAIGLDEIITVGYGTQKKENMTSAVSVIKSATLADRIADSPVNLLQGAAPGLMITQKSGIPGYSASIQVRENPSWKGQPVPDDLPIVNDYGGGGQVVGQPIFIIDGIIRDADAFSAMNSSDIESISILKDAASASIYGVKGGNGVLLVTTKQGKSGKSQINYTSSYSFQKPTYTLKSMNAYDKATRENLLNSFIGKGVTDNAWYTDDELEYFKTHSYSAYDLIWKNPTTYNQNLALSGGSGDTKYYISGSYLNNGGAIQANYDKYTFLSKLEGKITRDLKFSLNINASWENSKRPFVWSAANEATAVSLHRDLLYMSPYTPAFINGLATNSTAAILNGDGGWNGQQKNSFNPTLQIEYQVPWIKGLSFKGAFSYINKFASLKAWRQASWVYNYKKTGGHSHLLTEELDYASSSGYRALEVNQLQNNGGEKYASQEEYDRAFGHQTNFSMNYSNTFAMHNVSGFVGFEESTNEERFITVSTKGFADPANDAMDFSVGKADINKRGIGGSTRYQTAIASIISRLDYNYDQKYLFGFTFRADASYKFPPDSRWGYFPAASLGWNIAKEPFFKPFTGYISMLKLRSSYGMTGSDNTKAWQWQNNFTYNQGGLIFGTTKQDLVTPGYVPNTFITWEKNYSKNIGLDVSMPNNLISFTIDYWGKKTTDILDTRVASVPITVGAKLPAVNYGAGKASGLDLHIEHNNKIGKIDYHIAVNYATNNSEYLIKDQPASQRAYLNQIGKPMYGQINGLISEGIIRTQADVDRILAEHGPNFTIFTQKPVPGMLMYKDVRGQTSTPNADMPDGRITSDDVEVLTYLGKPKTQYSIDLSVGWKGFELRVLLTGVARYRQMTQGGNYVAYMVPLWQDMYTPDNINATMPISQVITAYPTGNASTFWLKDFSYLRAKTATLSYTLPDKLLKNTKFFRSIRVYANVENPFLLYNPSGAFDPEIGASAFDYPIMRSYTGGINIGF